MKIKYFLIIILLLASAKSNAQFLDFPNNCWQQRAAYRWDFTANFLMDKNVITYLYDTVVCSKTFKKCLFERTSFGSPAPDSHIYIRTDSGKVYMCWTPGYPFPSYPTCPDSSTLIYDFNLMPGDTFRFTYHWYDPLDTVVSVSYVNIGTLLRKKITFSHHEIIDGIGEINGGFLYWSNGFEGDGHILICQHDSVGNVYYNPAVTGPFPNDPSGHLHECDSIPSIPACYPPVGIYSITHNDGISVFPNPFTTHSAITFDKEIYNATFRLYNLYGQLVQKKNNISGRGIILARGNLQNGIYFYEVTEKGKRIYSGKAVVY